MPPVFDALRATLVCLALVSSAAAETLTLNVVDARVANDQRTGMPMVAIKLSAGSARAFSGFSAAKVANKTELRVDGKLVAEPVIREPITGGTLQISGDYDSNSARGLVEQMLKPDARIEVSAD